MAAAARGATGEQLRRLCERRLEDLALVALLIDGIECAEQVMIVALGLAEDGTKHVLGLWQGASENATVVKALLEDLAAGGLNPERRYLFVLDGSKALLRRTLASTDPIQSCLGTVRRVSRKVSRWHGGDHIAG